MGLSSSFIVALRLILCSIVLCAKENKIRNEKQALDKVLEYLHGYKIGHDYVLQLPALILSPVIIIPTKNDEKEPKANNLSNNSMDQTSSNMKREVTPIKLVLNNTKSIEENNDIEINFRQALNRGSVNKDFKVDETSNEILDNELSDNNKINENVTKEDNPSSPITTTEENQSEEITTRIPSTTTSSSFINEVTDSKISNDNKLSEMLEAPPDSDERWKNFTLNANVTVSANNTEQLSNNLIEFPSQNETSTMNGPYSAALYNNAFIDQLSITTNSYTNEESPLPPPQDDRWRSFSSLGEILSMPSGFRPLAGLYYDGFLDRPLIKMPGYVPFKKFHLF